MSKNDGESMLEGIPEHMKLKLIDLILKLDQVEIIVNKLECTETSEIHAKLTPIELAKFNWISIYVINSLFFAVKFFLKNIVYLKNSGVTVKDHPLMNELNRVRKYLIRINEIAEAEEAKKSQIKIDKESSARIIKRSLWQNAQTKSNLVNSSLNLNNKRESENLDSNLNKKLKID